MLYQRDYLQLLVKYGLEPPSQLADGTGPAKLDLFPEPRRGSGTGAPGIGARIRVKPAS